MRIRTATTRHILAVTMVLGMAPFVMRAVGQSTPNIDPPGVTSLRRLQPNATGDEILAKLVKENELRNTQLREYSAERTYAVLGSGGKVHARETVQMEYVAPDKKTFVMTSKEGSDLVRHMVLTPLMESETSAAAGKEHRDSSITPENYAFNVVGQEDVRGHLCYVVEAAPKRKDKYLFEGTVWIDSHDFAVVKIAGHPAKKLSFWITRADFVRQYEKIGDFWLPAKDETSVNVRLYGRKILLIEHHVETVNGVKTISLVERTPKTLVSDGAKLN